MKNFGKTVFFKKKNVSLNILNRGPFSLSFGEENLPKFLELYTKCADDQFDKKWASCRTLIFYQLEFEPKALSKWWKIINKLDRPSF